MLVPPTYTERLRPGAKYQAVWLAELFGLSEFTVAEYTFNRWSKKGNVELEIAFTSKQVASEWSARAEFLSIHFERIPMDVKIRTNICPEPSGPALAPQAGLALEKRTAA